ncbi:MAG: hypothetical protein JO202_10305 [Ktedonobacteraceae bacterium]|nr:hypothetical protein [Ktedonobacteraceae bacterium]
MSTHTHQYVVSPTEQAPWMPLEGLIEQWATLAHEATTPQMRKVIGYAFAALSSEQVALQSYHLATQYDQRRHTLCWSSPLDAYAPALGDLHEALREWMSVAYALESEARAQSDPACASTLSALVMEALTHCQRLSCIAHCVRTEQHARYQESIKHLRKERS